jgi:hypothetical protein
MTGLDSRNFLPGETTAKGDAAAAKTIDRNAFDEYIKRFNARDYQGVLEFWAKHFTVSFAGYTFHGPEEFIGFYRFFHEYVGESLNIDEFIANETLLAIEVRVHLQGKKELTAAGLKEAGYERLVVPPLGRTLEIPQFIHYHVAGGKFTSVVCALFAEPRLLPL